MKGSHTNSLSLHDFYTYLQQGSRSLHHIQVDAVLVTDHLGRTIRIPTVFCSDWKVEYFFGCLCNGSCISIAQSFDYIIKRYCEDSIGCHFIERGEYKMIRAQDSQVIESSRFASTAGSGMKFEISIVMRQTEEFRRKCPHCGIFDSNARAICGWIKWQVSLYSLHVDS